MVHTQVETSQAEAHHDRRQEEQQAPAGSQPQRILKKELLFYIFALSNANKISCFYSVRCVHSLPHFKQLHF